MRILTSQCLGSKIKSPGRSPGHILKVIMEIAPLIISLVYQALTAGAFLVLCSIGLMIVLGMMNIINLAHGEIMMIGAYVASLLVTEGLPFFLTLPVCFLVGVLVGLVIEFLFIRYLYSRILSALV